jgi:flagellar biosynthetic protein FliR
MTVNISFLPSLAAVFLLMFARLGTMVMLMPGLGERGVPMRIRLVIALVLTLVLLPIHRNVYAADLNAGFAPVLGVLLQEVLIGAVLGLTARLALSALVVAGTTIAFQLGLGFSMAIDPTQDQQSVLVSNFLVMLGVALIFATDMHHLAIGALDESYNLFKPGATLPTGDLAELMITTVSGAFRVGIQLAAPFLVFGILFNVGLGVLARLMPQLQVFFLGLPASILIGFAVLLALVGVLMGTFISYLGGVFEQIGPQT